MIAIPCQKDKENVEKRISSCCCVLLRVKFRRLTNIILTPSDRQMALTRRNCRVIFFQLDAISNGVLSCGRSAAVIKNEYFFIWTCSWCRLDVSLYDVIYPAVRYSFERCHENDYYIPPTPTRFVRVSAASSSKKVALFPPPRSFDVFWLFSTCAET